MYMMAHAVYLLPNTVHQVRLLMHMLAVVDYMGNAVQSRVIPDVHDGICSTPAVHLLANTEHQVRLLINMMSVVDLVGNAVHQCAS